MNHRPTDLFQRPPGDLAQALASGEVTARGLLDHYLERIERIDPAIGAYVRLDPKGAARAAEASDARRRAGRTLGPLDGMPICVKDNLLVADIPATWGSPMFAKFVPDHDEAPVAQLRAAGAVFVGKTNTPELAMRGVTENPLFPPTRNPFDPSRTPGGSSGGGVAAVAAGLAPLALATDGGGSIRRPAAHTGLFGLKTTLGRIARQGGFPPLTADCEVVGPIAGCAQGLTLMLNALEARDAPRPAAPARWRILVVERMGDAPVEPVMLARCRERAKALEAVGHEVEFGDLPFGIDQGMEAWSALSGRGLARLAAAHPATWRRSAQDFIDQATTGAAMSAETEALHLAALAALRRRTAEAFTRIDAILTPAIAALAWPIGAPYPERIAGREVGPRGHAVYTGWVNACGHPSVAFPVEPLDGAMIGLQLVGALHSDHALIDLAGRLAAPRLWPSLAL